MFFWEICAIGQELMQSSDLLKGRLKNGLTYYILPNDYPKGEAIFRLFIKSGSVYEEDDQLGLAHFIEHMAFNGTRNFPGKTMIEFLESKGAKFGVDFNAHTSLNETVYKLKMPVSSQELLDSTLMVLADIAGGLLLDSVEIENERGVIVSEWLQQTGPERKAREALLLELLNGSRYSQRLTIGDTSIIKNFPHQRLRDYYEKWYSPSVMAVAVVGDVDPKVTKKLIKSRFGKFGKVNLTENPPCYEIPDFDNVLVKYIHHSSLDKVELNILQLTKKPSSVKTEEDYYAYLQRQLINRLFKERFANLSFKDLPYNDGSYSLSSFINVKGVLMGSVELIPGRIKEGIITFARDVEQIFRYGFTSLEIEKIKTKYLNALANKAESNSPKESSSFVPEIYNDFFAGNMVVDIDYEYQLAKKYSSLIDSASIVNRLQQIRDLNITHYLLSYFDDASKTIPSEKELQFIFDSIAECRIEPYKLTFSVPDRLMQKEPNEGVITKIEEIKEIGVHRIILENGAEVYYKYSERDRDYIALSGFRKGGLYALDSSDYVNGIIARTLVPLSGAGAFQREALNHFLADKTLSLHFVIEKNRSGIVGRSDHKNIETLFKLLYLKWNEPRADSSVFRLIKAKTIEKYLTSNKTAQDTFYQDLNVLLNGRSYVRQELSDSVLEKSLRFERMLPVFQQNFGNATGFKFVILSDLSLDDVKPLIKKYIGGLPKGEGGNPFVYKGPRLLGVEKSIERNAGNNPRSVVSLVFQDYNYPGTLSHYSIKAEMMKAVIRARLLQILREDMGKVYSVGVMSAATKFPRKFRRSSISFSCSPEDVNVLIDRTFQELKLLSDDTDLINSILVDVKKNFVKDWSTNMQKNMYWSRAIRNQLFYEEKDWNSIIHYDKLVEAVTAEELAVMIKNNLLRLPVIKAILNPCEDVATSDDNILNGEKNDSHVNSLY